MQRMRFGLTSILLALLVAAPASGQSDALAEALAEALERMIATYGGEENLQKLDSMVQEWDLLALTRNQQGTDKRSVRLPEQLKVELTYPGKQETRVLNGDSGYAIFDDRAPAAASAMQTGAMRLQLMRLYSPLTLRDKRDALELSRSGGYMVLTLMEHGLQTDYVVDTDTWHIVKVMGKLSVNGMTMQFVTEYSDYSMVDGVLIHHRENKWVGGTNTAVLRLQRITVDADFDDDEFEPVANPTYPVIARIGTATAL
jgi:outer membrane lipoprotein-sorting protein